MSTQGLTGRTLALVASVLLVLSAFLPWDGGGRLAVEVWTGPRWATVGLAQIAVAALPAFAAVLADAVWPRALAALATGATVLVWLAAGPDGELAAGVAAAMAGTVALILAAAFRDGR